MTQTLPSRRLFCLLLCALLTIALFVPALAAITFPDLEGHWAQEAAEWCFQEGLMNGVETGEFLPEAPMTRGMLVTVLYRLAGSPTVDRPAPTSNQTTPKDNSPANISGFTDVAADSWYATAVAWAVENNIVTGYTADRFVPEENVNREQLAVFLYRYASFANQHPDQIEEVYYYQDQKDISAWAIDAVAWATAERLLGGREANCFAPQEKASRGEVATVLRRYVTGEGLAESPSETPNLPEPENAAVPILLYHHVADQGDPATTISAAVLESHFQALLTAGYIPVSLSQLRDFVVKGTALPENPVCITFDDGYTSNYTLAYPLLQKYNISAAIFLVGIHVGAESYRDTDIPIIPHFTYAQAQEMLGSGLVDIQSHTYDMHRWETYETETPVRVNALRLPTESLTHYQNFLAADFTRSASEIQMATGHEVTALAYPGGRWSEESEAVLRSLGVTMTFTTQPGTARLTQGNPECLYLLPRNTILGTTSAQDLLRQLEALTE